MQAADGEPIPEQQVPKETTPIQEHRAKPIHGGSRLLLLITPLAGGRNIRTPKLPTPKKKNTSITTTITTRILPCTLRICHAPVLQQIPSPVSRYSFPTKRGDGLFLDGRVHGLEEVARKVARAADVPAVVGVVPYEGVAAHALLRADVRVVEVGIQHNLHREVRGGRGKTRRNTSRCKHA